jgi:2-phosphoglycerate kinase
MKIFLYKLLISLVAFYIFFELTVGSKIDYIENIFNSLKDDNQRIIMKEKLKDEMRKAIKKENYLTDDERYLISNFIKKIKDELYIDKNN